MSSVLNCLIASLLLLSIHDRATARTRQELLDYIYQRELDRPVRSGGRTYSILMATPTTADELIELIKEPLRPDDSNRQLKTGALNVLSSLGAVDKESVPFWKVRELVEFFEARYDPKSIPASDLLEHAYWLAAQYGTDESLEFLIEKAESPTWRGGEMPIGSIKLSHFDPIPTTPRAMALRSLSFHPSSKVDEYIKKLQEQADFSQDEAMSHALRYLVKVALTHHTHAGIWKEHQAAWALKLRGFRLNDDGFFVPLDQDSTADPERGATSNLTATSDGSPIATSSTQPGISQLPDSNTSRNQVWIPPALGLGGFLVMVIFVVLCKRSKAPR